MPLYASTFLAPRTASSLSALLSQLKTLSKEYRNHPALFSLSAYTSNNVPLEPEELSPLIETLTTFSQAGNIGCLSGPIPEPPSLQQLTYHETRAHDKEHGFISCSLAVFDKDRTKLFRSTIPGKEVTQVGRWHAFRKRDELEPPFSTETGPMLRGVKENQSERGIDWENVWDSYGEGELPEGLKTVKAEDVEHVVYFSDKSPEGLANSLGVYPKAIKLGLIASSTPFVTARPVTLFYNQNIHSTGAVGVALLRRASATQGSSGSSIAFTEADPISDPMQVTTAEGNMINELDGGNPTQLLLDAIKKRGLDAETSPAFKENERFYLGLVEDGQVTQMYNITAGDPSRGSISLETPKGPPAGSQVQFFYRPRNRTTLSENLIDALPRSITSSAKEPSPLSTLSFATLSPDFAEEGTLPMPTDPERERPFIATNRNFDYLMDTFLAGSENGFMLSRKLEAPWLCTVPGSLASLRWGDRRDVQ
ncbi:hypothetical protein AX16_005282 [Volvariella volvacea WC 439]|nr:hypothetical protein AX16_005282 [Volvariella volvacea WC 439]